VIVVTAQQITAAARVGLAVTLTGVDGSTWDLVGGDVRLRSGVAGLGSPDPERWWRDSPAVDGSLHLGYRIPRGQVTLPLGIWGVTSLGWRDTQAAFMRAIDPSGVCYLSMRASDSAARTIGMRLTSGLAAPYEIDPLLLGYAPYTLEFAAENPYWVGDTQSYTWTGTSQIPISITVGKPVTNPGDVPSWPTWTINGPWTNAWVGPDSASMVRMAVFAQNAPGVPLGQGRVVDTDPRVDAVRVRDLTGADKWSDVTSRVFAPVPAGDTTVRILATSTTSSSSIALSFPALFRQPW
jgi:hypothetical protein